MLALVNKCFEKDEKGGVVEVAYKEWKDPHRDVMFLNSSSCGREEEEVVVAVDGQRFETARSYVVPYLESSECSEVIKQLIKF